ncbi:MULTISPECIES: hypothetical protein [unclassified Acinetobacter]|uniref:hypothetical protein n=1 Tax=unclassified Acinetobacter TaxID=196816 RepID=UPI0015D3A09E|nr:MULTISPECIES: hypothetical protein [unclassified Acinetobacter]
MKTKHTGNTLIVVLVLLLLIMIVGTWAIRGAITSLNITTNAQAQSLLVQNSDAIFFQLEAYTDDALKIAELQLDNGMIGFANKNENKGKELVYCVRKNESTDKYNLGKASIVYWQGSTIKKNDLGQDGYCKSNKSNDYVSNRNAVMTRVGVRSATENRKDWTHKYEGSDSETYGGKDIGTIIVNATSFIPNLSTASADEINKCVMDYPSFNVVVDGVTKDSVADCLSKLNVPYSSQEMEYQLRQVN